MFRLLIFIYFILINNILFAQKKTIKNYYDTDNKVLKEEFQLKESNKNEIDGYYKSFYQNKNLKSIGNYKANIPNGIWSYFYENGKLKMKGEILANTNHGKWYYYHENGSISMEGFFNKGNKIGVWKTYYDNNKLKSDGEYLDNLPHKKWQHYYENGSLKANFKYFKNNGYCEEYDLSGYKKAEGKVLNGVNDSIWKYYYPSGKLKCIGNENKGIKNGFWRFFYENGKLASEGNYENNKQTGDWKYYYENGQLSTEGYIDTLGKKQGDWQMYYENGSFKANGKFKNGTGEYTEYYENGKQKIKGYFKNGKYHGNWEYYYENQILEGECVYNDGEGLYIGYYENTNKKTEGLLKEGEKVGSWRLYKPSGEFAGYYRPFNSDDIITTEDSIASNTSNLKSTIVTNNAIEKSKPIKSKNKYLVKYFKPSKNEFVSLIVSANPISIFRNSLPIYLEYYVEQKFGVQYMFSVIRNPFLESHQYFEFNKIYTTGEIMAFSFKFYQKVSDIIGMPYFGLEARYTNLIHKVNTIDTLNIIKRSTLEMGETKYESCVILGNRWMKYTNYQGITFDAYIGLGIGYRSTSKAFVSNYDRDLLFSSVKKSKLSLPFRLGFSFGYVF